MNTGFVLGIVATSICLTYVLLNIHVYELPLGRVFVFGSMIIVLVNNLDNTFIYNLPGVIMFLFMVNLPSFIMIGWMHWAISEVDRVVKKYGCAERCVEEDREYVGAWFRGS